MTLAIQQNSPYQTPISDTTSEITGEKKSRSFFPKGRINRKKFLKLQVPLVIMSVFIGLVILLTENTNLLEWLAVNINPLILMFVGILFIILYLFAIGYSILVTLPSLARRLHDHGKSGKLLLLLLIPFVSIVAFLWLIGLCIFYQGDPETNKYGPPPTH